MKRIVYTILASLLIFMSVPEAASAKSADQVINIGKKYMGIKYRYGGTTPAGFDCSGYTQYVFREAGVSIPRTTGSQFGTGQAVAKSNLKTGDLVFFNTSGRGVSHVGIFIQGGKFIHASTSQGVTITALNDPYYWGSRYIGARRVKNFDAAPAVAAPVQKESPYITRGEVAKVLAEKLNLPASSDLNFNDVDANHPLAAEIGAVAAAGIFGGDNNGNFNPNESLTRAQLAKVLVDAFDLTGSSDVQFTDVKPGYWAERHINTLATNKVTSGYADGSFGISNKVEKKHFDTFINRLN